MSLRLINIPVNCEVQHLRQIFEEAITEGWFKKFHYVNARTPCTIYSLRIDDILDKYHDVEWSSAVPGATGVLEFEKIKTTAKGRDSATGSMPQGNIGTSDDMILRLIRQKKVSSAMFDSIPSIAAKANGFNKQDSWAAIERQRSRGSQLGGLKKQSTLNMSQTLSPKNNEETFSPKIEVTSSTNEDKARLTESSPRATAISIKNSIATMETPQSSIRENFDMPITANAPPLLPQPTLGMVQETSTNHKLSQRINVPGKKSFLTSASGTSRNTSAEFEDLTNQPVLFMEKSAMTCATVMPNDDDVRRSILENQYKAKLDIEISNITKSMESRRDMEFNKRLENNLREAKKSWQNDTSSQVEDAVMKEFLRGNKIHDLDVNAPVTSKEKLVKKKTQYALHIAVSENRPDIATSLLRNGAKLDNLDSKNETAEQRYQRKQQKLSNEFEGIFKEFANKN